MKLIQQQIQIDAKTTGLRLDQAIHQQLAKFSRSKIQQWINSGFIELNQHQVKPKHKVFAGDVITLDVPETQKIFDQPESIKFDILHQDRDIFIINKPAGLVVHPAAGHDSGTLVNGLLYHDASLKQLPRGGIVHRLDKDTTGIMVVARNLSAFNFLVDQIQRHEVKREYIAITQGVVTAGRTIDAAINRHPVDRKRMAVRDDGKHAITHFQVAEKFRFHSLINVQLETGRTHQIRVHLAHIRYPLLGDKTYGGRLQIPAGISTNLEAEIRQFPRQALHAKRLSFLHPESLQLVEFTAPKSKDFEQMLKCLRTEK